MLEHDPHLGIDLQRGVAAGTFHFKYVGRIVRHNGIVAHERGVGACYPATNRMDALFAWLTHYGYAGLFLLLFLGIAGLPIPDETLLMFSGYLIWSGRFLPRWTFLAGFAGACCGISLSYWIGRKLGPPFVHRYGKYIHLTEDGVHQVNRWFQKIGSWLLTVGYFIPGVRHFTALVAGMAEVEYPKFAMFAYSGAAIWVASFLTFGYFVGDRWEHASAVVHRYALLSALLFGPCAAVAWWFYHRRQRRTRRS